MHDVENRVISWLKAGKHSALDKATGQQTMRSYKERPSSK